MAKHGEIVCPLWNRSLSTADNESGPKEDEKSKNQSVTIQNIPVSTGGNSLVITVKHGETSAPTQVVITPEVLQGMISGNKHTFQVSTSFLV